MLRVLVIWNNVAEGVKVNVTPGVAVTENATGLFEAEGLRDIEGVLEAVASGVGFLDSVNEGEIVGVNE